MKKNTENNEITRGKHKEIKGNHKVPPAAPQVPKHSLIQYYSRIFLLPAVFYFAAFCILTYPLISLFSTHFFADMGDGLQNVWNIWWVNKAVAQLHQLPWYTSYLHYPYGISLFGHTLNPFNGFMGIFLLKFLTLVQTHNFIVIFAFVTGGFTAFLLAYYITGSYRGSIAGGFIFTFSNYHFSHAQGHLQLVSLEWIPLFVLFWYILVTKPSITAGVVSGIALFAVILCDYYYFFYCVLTGILIFIWHAINKKSFFFFVRKEYLVPLSVFFAVSLVTTIPLATQLIVSNAKYPLIGAHQANNFSLDLLAPFLPGGHWRFADLTKFYWSKLPGNIHESSVYMGLSVIFLIFYVWVKRKKKTEVQGMYLWYFMLVFFIILSLGPVLHVFGREVSSIKLPYVLLEGMFPLMKISGVPVRMMVMVMLSASVISALGFKMLFQQPAKKWLLPVILLIILFIEYLPKSLPSSQIPIPEYISVLKGLPGEGVADIITNPCLLLYYQTVHEKPMAFGYVSRTPRDVAEKDSKLAHVILSKEYKMLYDYYKIKYLVTGENIPGSAGGTKLICDDGGIRLYCLDYGKP